MFLWKWCDSYSTFGSILIPYLWFTNSPCAHFRVCWSLFATLKVGSACNSLCLLRDCLKVCQVCVRWLAGWQRQSYFGDRVVTYVSKHQCVQLLWRQCLQKCRCLMTSLWTVTVSCEGLLNVCSVVMSVVLKDMGIRLKVELGCSECSVVGMLWYDSWSLFSFKCQCIQVSAYSVVQCVAFSSILFMSCIWDLPYSRPGGGFGERERECVCVRKRERESCKWSVWFLMQVLESWEGKQREGEGE